MNDEQTPALRQAVENMANMREAYDNLSQAAEAYNTGKTELATNITAKGVQASADETLPELAEKVAAISQETIIYEGADSYGKQIGAGGALWDLYQVLADMKTRFMGTGDYAALIVCEYYKGYDSLVLQGADGYYTCDGDYYDYASPTHVWHDDDNGKMNRWVAFLYRNEGARLDITNTAISPRSMYIGGHIGTIEYFTNGRLTDLVCGIEDTDVVDNLLFKQFSQDWSKRVNITNVKNIPKNQLIIGSCVFNNIEIDNQQEINLGLSDYFVKSKAQYIHIKLTKTITTSNSAAVLDCDSKESYAPLVGIIIDANIVLAYDGCIVRTHDFRSGGWSNASNLTFIHAGGLDSMNSNANLITTSSCPNLNDILVGAMTTNLRITLWNPTSVLEDATKKAQLIENIKNHILARVSDATGGTQLVFTVSTNMYNNIASEQIEWQGETMSLADAFLTKNWLLAGA